MRMTIPQSAAAFKHEARLDSQVDRLADMNLKDYDIPEPLLTELEGLKNRIEKAAKISIRGGAALTALTGVVGYLVSLYVAEVDTIKEHGAFVTFGAVTGTFATFIIHRFDRINNIGVRLDRVLNKHNASLPKSE